MQQELQRVWKHLRARKGPPVYYMVYQLQEIRLANVTAIDGVLFNQKDRRKKPTRRLRVRIRIGDHQLDNTGRDGYDWKIYRHLLSVSSHLPQEVTPSLLRKRLWQLSDRRYKEALAQYHRKRYVRSLKVEIKDKSGDFSKESKVVFTQMPPPLTFDKKRWKEAVRYASSFSLTDPQVIRSAVSVAADQRIFVMVASDGSSIIKHKTLYKYQIYVSYLADNKEYLRDVRLEYLDREGRLPGKKKLRQLVQKTILGLQRQAAAPQGNPDEAPAILMPDVAGVLFHEALGHRLEAQRMLRESDGRTFRRKIGQKVIPSFLSVLDDPTLKYWQNYPLNGYYLIDDQGVRTRRVALIEEGILRGFLYSRKPMDKIRHSNGHGRAYFGRTPFSRQGNLLILSKRTYRPAKLQEKLLEEARRQGKRYAYIIDRASGGYTHTGTYGIQSFKNRPKIVYRVNVKTGKKQLVKGLEMIGTPLTVVNNIIATGTDYGVFNGYCGAESGYVPVSAIAPSLLLKTVELQRVKINKKKGYLLPPPFPIAQGKTKKTAPRKTTKAVTALRVVPAKGVRKTPPKTKAPKERTKAPKEREKSAPARLAPPSPRPPIPRPASR